MLARIAATVAVVSCVVPTQSARAATLEPTSWGGANLISYANSDFESGVGNWVAALNTTLSRDMTVSFAHHASLKLTATRAGRQAAALGAGATAPRIKVRAGETYRESAWFKAAPQPGRTVVFSGAFYDRRGHWVGSVEAAPVTLNASGRWQYASELITAPSGAAYMVSPRLTENGVRAGETVHMDEVLIEPYRAATLIGAKDPSTNAGAFGYANGVIGPLQADKLFYSASRVLPASYRASTCANLPADVTCVLAYKVPTIDVASFVASIPAGRNTILTWHQEPEHDPFAGSCGSRGANFVCQFVRQSKLIRSSTTLSNRANVWVADDASTYQYDPGTSNNSGGAEGSCAYTVPSRYVDFYFADTYESTADAGILGDTLDNSPMWTGWLSCVLPQNKPIGLAEYGVNCDSSANAPSTHQVLAADDRYLKGESFIPAGSSKAYTRPVILWEYWWYDNGGLNCQFTPGGLPDGAQAVRQWRANEAQQGAVGLFAALASGQAFE